MSAERATKHYITFVSLVLVFLFILSTEARAELYGSWIVVENNSGIPGQVAAELSVDVTDPGGGQVLFTFYNSNPDDADNNFFISDIYFDDGHVIGIPATGGIDNDNLAGYFELPANPSELPGANTIWPEFHTTSMEPGQGTVPHYSANGVNGVYGGESVGIYMDIGSDFGDVIDAIAVGFDPVTYYQDGNGGYDGWYAPSLRIGIKVQGIGELSDTYILTPIPASVVLGILGLGVAGWKLRKFA